MEKHKWSIVGLVIMYLNISLFILTLYSKTCFKFFKSPIWFILFALVGAIISICNTFFNEWEKFNADTFYLFSIYFLVELFLFICSCFVSDKEEVKVIYVMFLISCGLFWFIYFLRCWKIIKELNEDKYIFSSTCLNLALAASLVLFKSREIINKSFDIKTDYIYQFFAILANTCFPLIGMYISVRTEINKLDNPKKAKSELKKGQYNEVEQFISSFATIKDIDNLKKAINKKRKKLGKKKFADVRHAKRYIKKIATLEDLDNLEKIITEKRKELEH